MTDPIPGNLDPSDWATILKGLWVAAAPFLSVWAAAWLVRRKEQRTERGKICTETSVHAQRMHYVCEQGREANATLVDLVAQHELHITLNFETAKITDLQSQIREEKKRLRSLNERRVDLAADLNGDAMKADAAFGYRGALLVAAIKALVKTSDENRNGEVRAALDRVTEEIGKLVKGVIKR